MKNSLSFSIWFGGWMSMAAGLLLAAAHSIDLMTAGGDDSLIGKTVVFAAHLLLVFALFGLYEAQGQKSGRLGAAGMVLGIMGTIIVTVVVFVEMASFSGANVTNIMETGVNQPIYTFGPLLFVIGMILFAIAILKNKTLSSWGGRLLLIGTIIFSLGTLMGEAEAIISTIGAIFTGAGLVRLGVALVKPAPKMDTDSSLQQTF